MGARSPAAGWSCCGWTTRSTPSSCRCKGSGRVRLAEGGSLRVGYAANNGHAPTMIGRILVERGELTKEAATMQTVRQWLRDHPAEATALMQRNARYIFFREIPGDWPDRRAGRRPDARPQPGRRSRAAAAGSAAVARHDLSR